MEITLEPKPSAENQATEPQLALMQLLFGKHITYGVSAVARLGVPDHMSTTVAASSARLAAMVGAHPNALYRLMRMLACVGVFEESPIGYFRLTAVSELLCSNVQGSMRHCAIQFGDKWSTRAFEHFTNTLCTGTDSVTLAFGKNIFDYFAEEPEQAETFNQSMSNFSEAFIHPIMDGYDFGGIRRIADIGGGHGIMLSCLLDRYPQLEGVVYDLPNVIAGAAEQAHVKRNADRITFEGGSFFDHAPSGYDAYFLKCILHDWSDGSCRKILHAIRKEIPARGRLLICEQLVGEGPAPASASFLDIEMLAMTEGGRERTRQEFRELFASAGFELDRVVATSCPLFILEARPA